MQVSRVCLLFREQSPKKTCKNKGAKANSNAKAHIGQSWKFRLTPPAFPQRAFELSLVVSFPPTLQALAVLCWTKLLLPQQQVVLLSLKAPSFLQLRQLFGRFLVLAEKLHFQLPCGNFCSAAACPEGHRSALSIASHSSGVELSTRLPKQDFLFVPWPARCAKRTPARGEGQFLLSPTTTQPKKQSRAVLPDACVPYSKSCTANPGRALAHGLTKHCAAFFSGCKMCEETVAAAIQVKHWQDCVAAVCV